MSLDSEIITGYSCTKNFTEVQTSLYYTQSQLILSVLIKKSMTIFFVLGQNGQKNSLWWLDQWLFFSHFQSKSGLECTNYSKNWNIVIHAGMHWYWVSVCVNEYLMICRNDNYIWLNLICLDYRSAQMHQVGHDLKTTS